MYKINLDFDPITAGFDAREITKNNDNTYTVTRKFVYAVHRDSSEYNYYSMEAYCPCLTDDIVILTYHIIDSRGRETYGVKYQTNDDEEYNTESRSWKNSICDYFHPVGHGVFNRKYSAHIDDARQEQAVATCVHMVNDHPANIDEDRIRDYFEKYHIVFGKSAPTSPEEDPFLPDQFKRMIGLIS